MPEVPAQAIRVENLTKNYRSGGSDLVVFDRLNLSVANGERLAIIGESGAGKSTFLHLLGGLDRPSEGKIYFGQKDITSLTDSGLAEFRNREIGFVWQNHYLLPEFTALENVMMPLLIRGVKHADAERAALEKLERAGLRERASHQAGELSGGEQQRVVLSRALVGNPKVLLADEPTGNLDYRTGDRIMDLLDELHSTLGLTTILVTHNLSYAQRCDRICQLERGFLTGVSSLGTNPDLASPTTSGPLQEPPSAGTLPAERRLSLPLLGKDYGFQYV